MPSTIYPSIIINYVVPMAKKIGTVVPKLQLIYSGEATVFHCFSHSLPRWISDNGDHPIVYDNYNHTTLSLYYKQTISSRNITCLGTYENGSQFQAISELVVAGGLYWYRNT